MTVRDLGAPLAAILAREFGVRRGTRTVVGVAGETGSGKSVTADALASALGEAGVPALVLHQDDYYFVRPRTWPRSARGATA